MMTPDEKMMLHARAWNDRREQIDAVSSATIKLEMMGLTPENGMVECPPPSNIDPLRWRAMIRNFWHCIRN